MEIKPNAIAEEHFDGKSIHNILNSLFEKLDNNNSLLLERVEKLEAKVDGLRNEVADLRDESAILRQHVYNVVIDMNLLDVRLRCAGLDIAYRYDYDESQPYYFFPELRLPYEEYVKEGPTA